MPISELPALRTMVPALAAAALATIALAPFGVGPLGCGGRAGSCPGFDSCSDVIPCPWVRCSCDDQIQRSAPPKCRADGTCDTASDCAAVCTAAGSHCAKPPQTCDAYLATECNCASGDKAATRFTEAWNCTNASGLKSSAKDCNDACGDKAMGAGGGSGVGGGFGASSTSSNIVTLTSTGTL